MSETDFEDHQPRQRRNSLQRGDDIEPIRTKGKQRKRNIPVIVGGEEYTVRAPKSNLLMKLAAAAGSKAEDAMERQLKLFDQWIESAFGDDAQLIFDRLDDNEDTLDIDEINELIEKVTGANSPNPTT